MTAKQFFNTPLASSLKVSFDFYEIDDWDDVWDGGLDCFIAFIMTRNSTLEYLDLIWTKAGTWEKLHVESHGPLKV